MAKKTYALVGNWHFRPRQLGLSVYDYNEETGALTFLDNYFPNAAVGQTRALDRERGIIYLNNEWRKASLISAKIEPDGTVRMMNEIDSTATWPSWITIDKSKKYAIVSAMSEFEEMATLTAFRLENDGSLGDIADWVVPHKGSKMHCCVPDPTGELYLVIDRGAHRIYTFGLDREEGKLLKKFEVACDKGSRPRYCAFHPTLPIVYTNNEGAMEVCVWKYDVESGRLDLLSKCPILFEIPKMHHLQPSDIVLDADAKTLYVTVRGPEVISVMDVAEDGSLTLKQNEPCGGIDPRGFCISPDGRFAFSQNQLSHNITTFAVKEDGTLEKLSLMDGICPGNMVFYQV